MRRRRCTRSARPAWCARRRTRPRSSTSVSLPSSRAPTSARCLRRCVHAHVRAPVLSQQLTVKLACARIHTASSAARMEPAHPRRCSAKVRLHTAACTFERRCANVNAAARLNVVALTPSLCAAVPPPCSRGPASGRGRDQPREPAREPAGAARPRHRGRRRRDRAARHRCGRERPAAGTHAHNGPSLALAHTRTCSIF